MKDLSANPNRLLTTEQAAEYLGIKPTTLEQWRWNQSRNIPVYRDGRIVRYRLGDLDRFIDFEDMEQDYRQMQRITQIKRLAATGQQARDLEAAKAILMSIEDAATALERDEQEDIKRHRSRASMDEGKITEMKKRKGAQFE